MSKASTIHQRKATETRRSIREAAGWEFHEELRLDGRLPLTPGRMFRVSGVRGWFKFAGARTTPNGQTEVDCYGPSNKQGQMYRNHMRCFFASRVTKVARKTMNLKAVTA